MKRAKKARSFMTSNEFKEVQECDLQNDDVEHCITNLPKPICIDILLKLPLKCLLICRCVCKKWRNLIKDSDFVKLHFSQAESYPLIRPVGPTHVSRTLYFVDQPPKYDVCYESNYCVDCGRHVNMKLDTKLKIPLHNSEVAMSGEGVADTNLHSKRNRVTKLRPIDHKLNVINSCNGFLCLSEPLHNDPVMVCIPVTGEFIKLPEPSKFCENKSLDFSVSGLGFCPKTDCYKVVKMFYQETSVFTSKPATSRIKWCRVAEIHTLSTGTWKLVGYAPSPARKSGFSTYLNGTLNCLYLSYTEPSYISAFNFSEETFQSIPLPPRYYDASMSFDASEISMGELRGCLCLYDASFDLDEKMHMWVMKSYGDGSSWNIEFKINRYTEDGRFLRGLYEPLSYFRDGTVLFFHPFSNALFSYDPKDKYLKFLKIRGIKSNFEAIAYTPSFITLKDAMMGDDVEVCDVKWRCGGLKLPGESRTISLVEESADFASDFNLSSYEDE